MRAAGFDQVGGPGSRAVPVPAAPRL